jgi:hypothetical protein
MDINYLSALGGLHGGFYNHVGVLEPGLVLGDVYEIAGRFY